MYPIPGHAAFSLLCHRYLNGALALGPELYAVMAGALLPDLIDKPLNDVFHITPYGRYAMHSLFSVLVCGAVAFWCWGKTIGTAYSAGHFAHLIGDADFCPWFWPFVHYEFPVGIDTTDLLRQPARLLFPGWLIMETILLGLVFFLYSKFARRLSVQAAVIVAIIALAAYRITREKPEYALLETGE